MPQADQSASRIVVHWQRGTEFRLNQNDAFGYYGEHSRPGCSSARPRGEPCAEDRTKPCPASNAKAGDEGVAGSARGGRAPYFQLHRPGLNRIIFPALIRKLQLAVDTLKAPAENGNMNRIKIRPNPPHPSLVE